MVCLKIIMKMANETFTKVRTKGKKQNKKWGQRIK
jgi:hypothetical protein